jgi:alkanesulfonate monooxygenase SsuD/methylene tetrahydromethanopterin reductase-like flavin-dependent oxidoreductase (luciferase family)
LEPEAQKRLARDAARLGYQSLWTPIGADRAPFDVCALWTEASGLATGIAVAPLSSWPLDKLAPIARETFERCHGFFTLGVGSGRTTDAVIRVMREAAGALRREAAGVPVFLGELGPQMLRLAGERYDGAALNWCSTEQVAWSRSQVATGARAAGREPNSVVVHEYIRVCVDDDANAARLAFAKMVMTYALARPGADKTKGYRAHFTRMGFGAALDDLERRRDRGASEDEVASLFPDDLLRRVGYWGAPAGAREAFLKLARGLDTAIVRLVPASHNDEGAVRLAMEACAPG